MKSRSGFTIVELLIVIVVIAILATISIVVYSGTQQRAQAAKVNQDLDLVNDAIQVYYAEKGAYPSTGGHWYGYAGDVPAVNYVPGLAPVYIDALPQPNKITLGSEYIYNSNGTDYKLIAHDSAGNAGTGFAKICTIAVAMDSKLSDIRNCWAWGYWSQGGQGL